MTAGLVALYYWLWAAVVLMRVVDACYLHGTDSGECTLLTLDPVWRSTYMPFCFDAVQYPACIPKQSLVLPPSREFPNGRWHNNSAFNKDAWIQQNVVSLISQRVGYEKNKTMWALGKNEYGDVGRTRKRFTYPNGQPRLDCHLAFKNYFCWINFPRCDVDQDMTLPTCRSACENFFKTCNYDHGLWRCYKSKWFNGHEPDPGYVGMMADHLGTYPNRTYLREYFPGQPFRKNKLTTMGVERAICTPAIVGAGVRSGGAASRGLMGFIVAAVAALLARPSMTRM